MKLKCLFLITTINLFLKLKNLVNYINEFIVLIWETKWYIT